MLYKIAVASMIASASAAMTQTSYSDAECATAMSGGTVTIDSFVDTTPDAKDKTLCLKSTVASGPSTTMTMYIKQTFACDAKTVVYETCNPNADKCTECMLAGTLNFAEMPTADGCNKATMATSAGDSGIKSIKLSGFNAAGGDEGFFVCATAPCFGRDTTTATMADGETVLMSSLKSGDLVMDGPSTTARVIVNQHAKADALRSSLLDISHSTGELSLTPDHVLSVDGQFVAAREAKEGSMLGESTVSRVSGSHGGIINPLTTSGKIMASGVLSSTYPEWIASWALSYPIQLTVSNLLSLAFPETTQAYYDAHLEQFFQSTSSTLVNLKATLPAPLVALVFIAADFACAAGFVAFSLASLKTLAAFVAISAALKSRK